MFVFFIIITKIEVFYFIFISKMFENVFLKSITNSTNINEKKTHPHTNNNKKCTEFKFVPINKSIFVTKKPNAKKSVVEVLSNLLIIMSRKKINKI